MLSLQVREGSRFKCHLATAVLEKLRLSNWCNSIFIDERFRGSWKLPTVEVHHSKLAADSRGSCRCFPCQQAPCTHSAVHWAKKSRCSLSVNICSMSYSRGSLGHQGVRGRLISLHFCHKNTSESLASSSYKHYITAAWYPAVLRSTGLRERSLAEHHDA